MLHQKFSERGLRILAFPCNQFGAQEPWEESIIKHYLRNSLDVEFDLFSKVHVNGHSSHPFFKFLKSKLRDSKFNFIKWNFGKFLIDRRGVPRKRYGSITPPLDIEDDIVQLLEE
ncbi:hypothetical protein CRM22_003846 [Opisthorchis felineus]|uniref:Glutathione peroxidase n=1 Tax=Opisthorchis felineus TaxID=147828 RepID=A0A4S2LZ72_OPIFE|nr:hypothetical protein CRM22_003846 [Opisthorchis felineus]TGZ69231.1 hypothetical protein CRM22_003846 [Opisthorchis felineus]